MIYSHIYIYTWGSAWVQKRRFFAENLVLKAATLNFRCSQKEDQETWFFNFQHQKPGFGLLGDQAKTYNYNLHTSTLCFFCFARCRKESALISDSVKHTSLAIITHMHPWHEYAMPCHGCLDHTGPFFCLQNSDLVSFLLICSLETCQRAHAMGVFKSVQMYRYLHVFFPALPTVACLQSQFLRHLLSSSGSRGLLMHRLIQSCLISFSLIQ